MAGGGGGVRCIASINILYNGWGVGGVRCIASINILYNGWGGEVYSVN